MQGAKMAGQDWAIGELEVAVLLHDDTTDERRPVTSRLRRSVMRWGLSRERMQRWARAMGTKAEELRTGIREGALRVPGAKKSGQWGRHVRDKDARGLLLAALLDTELHAGAEWGGKTVQEAVEMTAPGEGGKCRA
jgi:hypothetical protein